MATPTAAVKVLSTELRVRLSLQTGECVHVNTQPKDLGAIKGARSKLRQRLATELAQRTTAHNQSWRFYTRLAYDKHQPGASSQLLGTEVVQVQV